MIESGPQNINSFHLVGIVPVAGEKLDFDFPWHDCLQPIGKNYLAVERAIWECVCAGCETIWIVCHDDMQPLIRHRIGEYAQDPKRYNMSGKRSPEQHERIIPIYYVPIHPKDRDKRDCLSWSVLYGALTAYWLSRTISKWVAPDKYYAAFPYGVYDPEIVLSHRKSISSKKTFNLSYNGKTVKDNEYLGFTFDAEDFKEARKIIRKEGTGKYIGYENKEMIPLEERWSARYFKLDKVFRDVKIVDTTVEIPWYHNIEDWDGLRNYLGSENKLDRPSKDLLGYHEWNPIGVDSDSDEL